MTPLNLRSEFHAFLALILFLLLFLAVLFSLACLGATMDAFGTDAGLCYRLGLAVGASIVGLAALSIWVAKVAVGRRVS